MPFDACHILDTGYCLASEHLMIRGGRRIQVQCHALAALLHHPREGWLLWDTGYAPRMLDATRKFPFRLYRWATPLRLGTPPVIDQLPRLGIAPSQITRILISHFHADHIAGLRDFPDARFLATPAAYADIQHRRGISALRRAFIPSLLPDDFHQRLTLLPIFSDPDPGNLGPSHDLFADNSARLVHLPGHAAGQIGLLAQTPDGTLFFVADGAWLTRSICENRPPHLLTNLTIDSAADQRATLTRLHHFHRTHPQVELLPTHCPEVFAKWMRHV